MYMCVSCNLCTYLGQALGGPDGGGISHVGVEGDVGVGVGGVVGLLGGDGSDAVAG
jgi:hypothetical protein